MISEYNVKPMTYLNWVLVWINAISDSFLWVDSPDCFFFKVDHVFGNHDLNSTLKRADSMHRFLTTVSDVDKVIWNNNSELEESLYKIANNANTKLLFVSSMPMAQIIGVDYSLLINNVIERTKKDIFHIPSRSMTGSWLDWYSDLLFSLAKNIDISWANPVKNSVAIVWNLFDRNEWDCIWNIEELKKIFTWLWIDVISIWLDGGNYEEILKIKNAQTIISLPYWRKAAKKIANRLRVNLLELDLPFWITKTVDFIEKLWKYFNVDNYEIQKFIEQEFIENNIGILKWAINKTLFNKNISFYWDPYLFNWIIDFSKVFWLNIKQLFVHWEINHFANLSDDSYKNEENKINYSLLNNINREVDLYIINSANTSWWIIWEMWRDMFKYNDNLNIMEFWFPSYWYHCFTSKPYYGIKWSLNFINRIFNILNK